MIQNAVKTVLFLGGDAEVFLEEAAALFYYRNFLYIEVQGIFSHYLAEILKESSPVAFRAQSVLHIPCSGLSAVFVVAILYKCQNHGFNIVQYFRGIYSFVYEYAHFRVVSKAAGAVNVEGVIPAGNKSKITEGGVCHILWRIRETDLQLSGHFHLFNESQEKIGGFPCIWKHVKVLFFLYSGERGNHDISGKVTAASSGDNIMLKRFLDKRGDGNIT